MERICVVGSPGSGKSFFSKKLSRITGLPCIHLDNIWWNSDITHCTREEFDERLADVLSGEKWIIDGDYSRTAPVRFAACDRIFLFKIDREICLSGIRERRGIRRDDCPFVEEDFTDGFEEYVIAYPENQLPIVLQAMEGHWEKTTVFHTREEADLFLKQLEANSFARTQMSPGLV